MREKYFVCLAVLVATGLEVAWAHNPRVRTPINIPDIPGYLTLKCDFHTHTVFSDGSVWPDIRSEEAWREGLDAIAITDHIEYQPHKEDLPTNHNRSFQIAKPHGDGLDLLVIPGSEVTRDMPPGHLNAVFVKDAEALETEDWRAALQTAADQGAFVFWNHPGWTGQQPDGVARWYPEHTSLVEARQLHGIEVANSREYYPEAHRWCLEKGLTMLSNSDVHGPIHMDYFIREGDHRPVTLVFARERSLKGIRDALFARRTAVYSGNLLIGDESFLRPIFEASVALERSFAVLEDRRPAYLQISNSSDVDFEMELLDQIPDLVAPESLLVEGGKTVLLTLRAGQEGISGTRAVILRFQVTNLKIAPESGLVVEFPVQVIFRSRSSAGQ